MIARRPMAVTFRDLEKLFNLPEGVEIFAVHSDDRKEEITFTLVSEKPVEGVTIYPNREFGSGYLMRRVGLSHFIDQEKEPESEGKEDAN